MISPSSRKSGGIGNIETPLRGSPLSEAALNKAIAELETVSGGTGSRTHPAPQPLPPDLQDVPERVPSIDPLLAARYWKEALDYVDFAALAATGKKEVKPLAVFEFKTIGDKAGMTSADIEVGAAGGKPPDEELDVHVVVALWENNRRGTREPAGRRHPVMAVPAILVDGEFLAPRTTAAPVINERYLSPQLAAGCFSVGDRDEANGHLTKALVNLIEDPTASPGWGTWWRTSLGVLQELLCIGSADRLEPALTARATEISLSNRLRPSGWGLYAAIYPAGGGGTEAVAKVYRSLASNFGTYPRDMALFQRLCGGANALPVARLPADIDDRLLGHMDEYDGGSRSLFPLDATQRKAVRAILSLKAGEMQAVNGPPGSGKTSMLRAVVASVWVSAALRRKDCPILVACGATNQSVTNVIEAFSNAPHPDASVPHARRWISDAASYGAYLPSSNVLNDASKQAELARFVCLKKSSRNGFLYEYVNRNNVLNPAKALEYEQVYLCRARDALLGETGVIGLDTVESAVQLVWQVLDRAERQRCSFEQGLKAGGDAIEMGYRFVRRCEAYWTPTRRKVALDLLERLGGDPRDCQAAQEFMDLNWRAEAFHWAARYWEGRFLLAQRERLFSRHPLNVEEALRRLCMLTPCLVSTLHTAPQFAEIDIVLKTPEDHRSHVFGVIDLLVVDEAGQALPELAGAAFALAKKAAVVGDLKQLAPIWNNSELAEMSILNRVLGAEKTADGPKSILEGIFRSRRSVASGSTLGIARLMSLWKDADDDGVTLQFHYRCKPSIIDYCNHLSYSGTLRPKTNEDEYFPEPALGWVEVEAEPKSVGGSYRNDAEADEIISWIVERWPVWRQDPKTGGKPIQEIVAIITAYRQQADYLKHRLTAAFDQARSRKSGEWPGEKDVEKVTIGTVHRLQGAERPIVCFSLVEGPDQAGGSFIDRDASLLNVAVSRAKRSFIVFANPRRLFRPFAEEDGQTVLAPTHQLGAHLRKRPEAKLLYPDKLVLIESTGKVAALSHLLGKSARVIALGGAPLGLDREKGVNIAAGFVPNPTPEAGARQGLEQAAAAISSVEQVVFATDDDRMGDYIAWQAKRLLAAQLGGCRTGRVLLTEVYRQEYLAPPP
jgi:hypothetical protein